MYARRRANVRVWYHKNLTLMLRFETAGESHGECLVATLNGLPAGIPISLEAVNRELWRRQQGYGRGGRMKIETDRAEIVAGVRHSHTIGAPLRPSVYVCGSTGFVERAASLLVCAAMVVCSVESPSTRRLG